MVELEKSRKKNNTKVLPELSKAEYRVADLLTRGLSEKEIAAELFLSRDTIHTHTYNIRKKWDARCAVDVARKFILSLDDPKKYFSVLLFLTIQFHIIVDCAELDLRRPNRTTRVLRSGRTGRKKND